MVYFSHFSQIGATWPSHWVPVGGKWDFNLWDLIAIKVGLFFYWNQSPLLLVSAFPKSPPTVIRREDLCARNACAPWLNLLLPHFLLIACMSATFPTSTFVFSHSPCVREKEIQHQCQRPLTHVCSPGSVSPSYLKHWGLNIQVERDRDGRLHDKLNTFLGNIKESSQFFDCLAILFHCSLPFSVFVILFYWQFLTVSTLVVLVTCWLYSGL